MKLTLKYITFCCQDCGNRITYTTVFYGQGRCPSCSKKGNKNPLFGKPLSKSHRAKISKSNIGKKLSKEACKKISLSKKGNKNPMFGVHNCGKDAPNFGKKCSIKTKLKISKAISGKNNGNYINGQGNTPYPMLFNNILKLEIRQRDNFTCQRCQLKEQNHFRDNKQINLTIHHIDYNKFNCKESNLITLCNNCNAKANYNRDYWFAYYTYMIKHFKERVSTFPTFVK
jgi:hypothetical protein